MHDPVLRVGPKGCKLSVNLCCSPEIKYLMCQKESCGVAEGVQIVKRESKRDGYSLLALKYLCKALGSKHCTGQKRGFVFVGDSPSVLVP